MRSRTRKIGRFRRNIAWLVVAALTWSSGQGAALSAAFQLAGIDTASTWHCMMLAGGGAGPSGSGGTMPADHVMPDGMTMAADAPMDTGAPPAAPIDSGPGFCPVCSLTGCSAPSVIAQAEFQHLPPVQRSLDAVRRQGAAPRLTTAYDRPRTRAPPLSA
ncbi:MAG: hypothetical protein HQ511_04780 [Rhodospirillales bacterium]|nr:hypothetical protein [Rhodospirillales bacterium]